MDEDAQSHHAEPSPGAATRPWLVIGAIAIVALIGVLALFATSEPASDSAEPSGEFAALTEFPLATADGSEVTLALHTGEPIVLNYFAAWCPPCAAELPDFQAVSEARIDEVTFVGISRDNDTGSWLGLMEQTGVTFPNYYEGGVRGSFEQVQGLAMPTTVFITADGEIAEVFSGPLNQELLNEKIDEHLVEAATPETGDNDG